MKLHAVRACILLYASIVLPVPHALIAEVDGMRDVLRDGDSVYIRDVKSGRVLGQHETVQVPAASLIKLFVMVESFKAFRDGRIQREAYHSVSRQDMVGGAGHLQHGGEGRQISWLDLVRCMIQDSDNTATNILIRMLGMAAVNQTALQLGCHSTVLARLMMDTAAVRRGVDNLTTARDVGRLLALLHAGSCVDRESDREMVGLLAGQSVPHKLGAGLPGVAKIVHKTGEIALRGMERIESDAGIIAGPGGEIVMVVISRGSDADVQRIRTMGRRAWDLFGLGSPVPGD